MRATQKLADDIRSLMASSDPLTEDDFENAATPRSATTFQRIVSAPRQHRTPRRHRSVVIVGGVIAAAAAIAASAVAFSVMPPAAQSTEATPTMLKYTLAGYSHPVSQKRLPSAHPELLALAKLAARQTEPKIAANSVGYVVTREWYMSTAVGGGTSVSVLTPEDDQTWTSPQGQMTQIRRQGKPQDLSPVGSPSDLLRAAESGAVEYKFSARTATTYGPLVQHLSTTPSVLRSQLTDAADPGAFKNWSMQYYLLNTIASLQHQVVSPDLEAALWRVLAAQSGIEYLGRVRDRAGREGEAICIDSSGAGQERLVLIISPKTGMLLGEEDLFTSNPGGFTIKSYPAVKGYITYLGASWVGKMGSTNPEH